MDTSVPEVGGAVRVWEEGCCGKGKRNQFVFAFKMQSLITSFSANTSCQFVLSQLLR